MNLDTMIALISYLNFSNAYNAIRVSSLTAHYCFGSTDMDRAIHFYEKIDHLISELCCFNIEVSLRSDFDASQKEFNYTVKLVEDQG